MPLAFRPACLPLAQSGFPHRTLADALALLHQTTPALLTCPRLPRRSNRETLHMQSMLGFPGLVVQPDTGRLYVDRNSAEAQLNQLGMAYLHQHNAVAALPTDDFALLSEMPRLPAVAGGRRLIVYQLQGPVSLGLQITDEQQRPLAYDAILMEALVQHLALRASWLYHRVQASADQVLLWLHEPFLHALGTAFCPLSWVEGIDLVERVFVDLPAIRGVGVSDMATGQAPGRAGATWEQLFNSSLEFVALKSTGSHALARAAAGLHTFFERQGVLAWGLVASDDADTLQATTVERLTHQFAHLLDDLDAAGIPPERVVQASFISTDSGLAHLSVAAAEHAWNLCGATAQRLREVYTV